MSGLFSGYMWVDLIPKSCTIFSSSASIGTERLTSHSILDPTVLSHSTSMLSQLQDNTHPEH